MRRKADIDAFQSFLDSYGTKESTSIMITQEKYDLISKYLTNSIENPDPNKKFHFKNKQFNIKKLMMNKNYIASLSDELKN